MKPVTAKIHRASRTSADNFWSTVTPEKHRCTYGSSGRCPCGLHRDPMRATGIEPIASSREKLSFQP